MHACMYQILCSYQHISSNTLRPWGQVVGIGRCRLLLPTPQITAELLTFCEGGREGGREARREGGGREGGRKVRKEGEK